MKESTTRVCESGAIRDTGDGKLEVLGFNHPFLDFKFNEYMHRHRKMADGSLRDSDNWWGGFGKKVTIQSLCRHVEDLKLLHSGYFVYEFREGSKAERKVFKEKLKELPKGYIEITIEECCCAIRFNSMAYMLDELKEQGIAK